MKRIPSYGLCCALALVYICYLMPPSYLLGRAHIFEDGDAASSVAGWLFFAREAWQWPLLVAKGLGYPDGTLIAFTDSVPIAAIMAKLARGFLGERFHYFGLWQAFNLLVQALAANAAIRALGTRSIIGSVAAVVFAITWPALLVRQAHVALSSHSILLIGLAYYFRVRAGDRSIVRACWGFSLLILCGLLIHPYFVPQLAVLYFAYLIEKARHPLRIGAALALSAAFWGGLAFVFGYGQELARASISETSGFGVFAMNLYSPFCGGGILRCSYPAPIGHYEGFNYLGLGVLLLLGIGLKNFWRDRAQLRNGYLPLFWLMIGLFFYSLSSKGYAGDIKLFSYKIPEAFNFLVGSFRCSGRMFWIIGYLIMLLALHRTQKMRWGNYLLIAAIVIQWFDTQLYRDGFRATAAEMPKDDRKLNLSVGSDILHFNLYPAFACNQREPDFYIGWQLLAARLEKTINTSYRARPPENCAQVRAASDGKAFEDTLYITSRIYFHEIAGLPSVFSEMAARGACVGLDHSVVCGKRSSLANSGLAEVSLGKGKIVWLAKDLPSDVGTIEGDFRVAKSGRNKPGFLSFGPYMPLKPGKYTYEIEYSQAMPGNGKEGHYELAMHFASKPDKIQLGGSSFTGRSGDDQSIRGVFTVDRWNGFLELRTFFAGDGDFTIKKISLMAEG